MIIKDIFHYQLPFLPQKTPKIKIPIFGIILRTLDSEKHPSLPCPPP